VLHHSKQANVGHIGSCLCVAEILAVLYRDILTIPHPVSPERDRFVLSKGHAALALYAALTLKGILPRALLESFGSEGSQLAYHPEHTTPGVDLSTGSLGQGLSFATGIALGARLAGKSYRAFALLSDAECNEGSVWESVMFASHHKLTNLIALIDLNTQQALGYTEEVLSLAPMAERWRAFGWNVFECDGHDERALFDALTAATAAQNAPSVIVCHTVFGKGVSFMERKIEWHYLPMNDEQYHAALAEVG
jgi:transketolase